MNAFFSRGLSAVVLAACAAGGVDAQVFTQGNLVVSFYGNTGTATANGTYADGSATPITLEQYTTNGSYVSSYTLPVADSGSNYGIVGEYGSSSEGNLQLTGNGQYLTIGGYSATPALAGTGATNGSYSVANGVALAQAPSADVPRLAAVIDAYGNVNTSTAENTIYNTNNIRSVYSADGSQLYLSGQGTGTSNQGLYYTPAGTNTVNSPSSQPTPIYTTYDTRFVTGYGGNLYVSQDKKNGNAGIYMFSGNPTGATTPVRITAANNGNGVNYSPEGFFFANATTLYVADTGVPKAGGTGDGGIQKWVQSGGVWSLAYTMTVAGFVAPNLAPTATSGETGFEAVTGQTIGGSVQLFAASYTAGDANPNGLYAITDTLAATTLGSQTFTELAASGTDSVIKGVSFAPSVSAIPEPSTYAALAGAGVLGLAFWRRRNRRG